MQPGRRLLGQLASEAIQVERLQLELHVLEVLVLLGSPRERQLLELLLHRRVCRQATDGIKTPSVGSQQMGHDAENQQAPKAQASAGRVHHHQIDAGELVGLAGPIPVCLHNKRDRAHRLALRAEDKDLKAALASTAPMFIQVADQIGLPAAEALVGGLVAPSQLQPGVRPEQINQLG